MTQSDFGVNIRLEAEQKNKFRDKNICFSLTIAADDFIFKIRRRKVIAVP